MSQVKLSDSNISAYGGADHQAQKAAKANMETEWKGAGEVEGVLIWRIENFGVKPVSKELYGTFFSGDSYVILHTYKKTSQTLYHDLYFYLGSKSTTDEIGTAAYKAVELDDYLDGKPVQHREVEGSESQAFLNVFGGKISVMDGGIDSAFNAVKPEEYRPRLLHVKGKKQVVVKEVKCEVSSLNDGDVFILDAGLTIIMWVGKYAGIFEKRKGTEIVSGLKEARKGKPKSEVIDTQEQHEFFWTTLGSSDAKPKPVAAAIPDDDANAVQYTKVLLHLSDATGTMACNKIAETQDKFKRSLMNPDDIYILDLGTQVYIWVGRGSNREEKKNSMKYTVEYLEKNNKPLNVPVTRVMDGSETDLFNSAFEY